MNCLALNSPVKKLAAAAVGLVLSLLLTAAPAVASCRAVVRVVFNPENTAVLIQSNKDLSNVVLQFCDGSPDVKYEDLSGRAATFSYDGKSLAGVWVKSGCNASGDGPGYGEFFGTVCWQPPPPTPTPVPTASPNPTSSPSPTPSGDPSPTPSPSPELIRICYLVGGASSYPEQRYVTEDELRLLDPADYSLGKCPEDCMGVPGGEATVDLCGVCGGDNSTCRDCRGIPNGPAQLDICGVCEGDGRSCLGCDQVPNSGKIWDACGVCGGDSTSCLDCAGVPKGETAVDACGVCGGDNSSCLDCAGVPNGGHRLDVCGVCGGDGWGCAEISECIGQVDLCGVCNGGGACLDCAGIPNGGTKIDCCGVCGGDGSTCLDQCRIYNLGSSKRRTLRSMQELHRSIRLYSQRAQGCGAAARDSRRRMGRAKLLLQRNRALLNTFIANRVKVCDTPYCTKTSFAPVLGAVKRSNKQLYQLSRQAQYASISACQTTAGSANRGSQGSYRQAAGGLNRIPSQRCD